MDTIRVTVLGEIARRRSLMMRFLLTTILAASVAFAAIGSRGSDLVLCVGAGGHVAVEHEHASGDCRDSGEDHDDHHNDFQDHAGAVTLGQAPA
ncbi:MAG: hypothetical protein M3Q75_15670, partial [Gemmatimonadota bacterium]|nr:hypothetical protein [Gemmatimonadota bacterium]